MDAYTKSAGLSFTLGDEQVAIRDMARDFAAERLAPSALAWDREKFFPVDVIREAALLGMGGIYGCGADFRGVGDRVPVGGVLYFDP
jgi:alkylation response protein AidB-like acyl-CoA dehydrogenase